MLFPKLLVTFETAFLASTSFNGEAHWTTTLKKVHNWEKHFLFRSLNKAQVSIFLTQYDGQCPVDAVDAFQNMYNIQ